MPRISLPEKVANAQGRAEVVASSAATTRGVWQDETKHAGARMACLARGAAMAGDTLAEIRKARCDPLPAIASNS